MGEVKELDFVLIQNKINNIENKVTSLEREFLKFRKWTPGQFEKILRLEWDCDVLKKKVRELQEEQGEIKRSLEGNVTSKVLKSWVIGTGAILAALGTIGGIVLRVLR